MGAPLGASSVHLVRGELRWEALPGSVGATSAHPGLRVPGERETGPAGGCDHSGGARPAQLAPRGGGASTDQKSASGSSITSEVVVSSTTRSADSSGRRLAANHFAAATLPS
jgi:hypothetical protein